MHKKNVQLGHINKAQGRNHGSSQMNYTTTTGFNSSKRGVNKFNS